MDVIADIKYNIRNTSKTMVDYGKDAIKMCAEDLLEKSRELAPKDTGALRESGHIDKHRDFAYTVVYDVTVADRAEKMGKSLDKVSNPDYKYGRIQHDNLYFHHDIGQALYLEEPYEANKDFYIDFIRDSMRRAIRKGVRSKRGKR